MGKILLFVALAGAAGGFLNAALGGGGLILPEVINLPGGPAVLPGFLGNVFVGAVAALLSFGLYGPLSGVMFVRASGPGGQQPVSAPTPAPTPVPMQLTLAALAGAIIVGYSGGRWVTSEADRQLNRATAELTAVAAAKALEAAEKQRPQSRVTRPTQRPSAALQAIQTSPPLASYQKALDLQRMVNALADDH
jgi:hypothetical protein